MRQWLEPRTLRVSGCAPARLVEELFNEGLPVLETRISTSVKMRESHEQSTPLVHLAPRHKLTEQFLALYDELDYVA